jgi:hypothetical protein
MMRVASGAGTVVPDTGTVVNVAGMVVGGGGLVTTVVTSVIITVVTGRVTGTRVVTGAGSVVCTGTLVAGVNEDVISGFTLWISRLPMGATGVIVFPGML